MAKLTPQEFIAKANDKHSYKYNYSLTIYKSYKKHIVITCPIHGIFKQRPDHHLSGHGCKFCAGKFRGCNRRLNKVSFINKAENIHGNKYNYNFVEYTTAHSKIKIICNVHGVFEQTPNGHLNSKGCVACGVAKRTKTLCLTKEEFINRANIIHNNLYDYSLVVYLNSHTKVKIICKQHGEFEQTPTNHLNGQSCPKCSVSSVSKSEIQWLNSLGIPLKDRQVTLHINGRRFIVDGFDNITKTVYEFNGDFWHGNLKIYNPKDINPVIGKTYGFLYQKTINKQEILKSAGYNVISIWESEFGNL